jgi:hypothetical protein
MHILTDKEILEIWTSVAARNDIDWLGLKTASLVDSMGQPTVDIAISITPGSSSAYIGGASSRAISQMIKALADAGEQRLPIVRLGARIVP